MLLFYILMMVGAVSFVVWKLIKDDVKVESVSRDLETKLTEAAVERAKLLMEAKLQAWNDEKTMR